MSQSLPNSYPPEIMGYRIRQYVRNQQDSSNIQQTHLKIILKNQSNRIPKIRNDVICNGKHYPFIPLFTFTSEDDLKTIEQISTVVLRDQNQILCEILTGKIKEVRASQFKQLKTRFKSVFSLDLKIDPQELFLILISDQITNQTEFNDIFDSISENQFVNLFKNIFENCPNRVVPKILRKIAKYFNSTKGRPTNSVERLKKVLKVIKSSDQAPEVEQKQESQVKLMPNNQQNQQEWIVVPKSTKKASIKKQTLAQQQKVTQVQQKPSKKVQANLPMPKKVTEVLVPFESQKVTKKVTQTERVKKTEKVTKKQKFIKAEKEPIEKKTNEKKPNSKKQEQKVSENEENWQDVDGSEDSKEEVNVKKSLSKMVYQGNESDEGLKYFDPKKKNNKNKNNTNLYLDPSAQTGVGKKQQYYKKQKKNYQTPNNLTNQGKPRKPQAQAQDQTFDRRNNNNKPQYNERSKNNENGRNNNEQSTERGKRQFSRDFKKLDSRILLGINGGSDAVWREKMRPPRYLKENNSYEKNRGESFKENLQTKENQRAKPVVVKDKNATKQTQQSQPAAQASKNLSLQKIFSIPDDVKDGKYFKFEKRNYNLFVNKLFWVNISGDQVTVQKQGKGYIRKYPIEIIDNGKAIMGDGLTINTDGLSNLEDGGTAFGNPVFEEFTPDGQWFHIISLDVFAYV